MTTVACLGCGARKREALDPWLTPSLTPWPWLTPWPSLTPRPSLTPWPGLTPRLTPSPWPTRGVPTRTALALGRPWRVGLV